MTDSPATPSSRDLTGRTLHHYRIVEKLGAGGMGEVWVAEDLHLERRVALKLLPASDEVDSDRLLRFEREAKTVASLDHPNIVTLHSIEEADSIRFLTMELVTGPRLDQAIPEGGMDLATFLGLAVPIADAVAAAHARGITHRDLKPGNVVMTPDGRPKVLDFGLAKLRDPEDDDDEPEPGGGGPNLPETRPETLTETLTRTATRTASRVGEVAGTVPYMSPEQLSAETVGPQSDVFSLGVVFHEMLTGRRPFGEGNLVQLMASILRDPAPRLAAARPDLPQELGELLQRCLAKKPPERFADAGALRDALVDLREAWLSGSQTSIPAPTPADAGRPSRLAVFGLAGLALAGVLAVLGFVQGWLPDPTGLTEPPLPADDVATVVEPRRIAVLPFDDLGQEDDSYFTAGIAEEIRSRLATVRGLGVISRSAVSRYVADGLSRDEIADALGVDYLLDGTVRWDPSGEVDRVRVTPQLVRVADRTQVWSATYDRRLEDIFSVQTEIAEEVIRSLDVALFPGEASDVASRRPTSSLPAYQAFLRARDHLSDSLYDRAGYDDAIRELKVALQLDPDFGIAHADLSSAHSMMYHLGHDRTPARADEARRHLERAIELAPEASEVRFARGYYLYRVEKDYDGALANFRAAVEHMPSSADGFEAMGYVLRRQGKLEEAAEMLERAAELTPGSGGLLIEVATTRLFLRQYDAARALFEQATLAAPNDANAYRSLALAHWLDSGDLAAAREVLESMPPSDEAVDVWYWFHQHLFEGDYAAAQTALDAADSQILRWTFFAYPVDLLRGQALQLQGRDQDARDAFTAAVEQLRREIGRSPEDSRLHSALGLALAGLGDDEAALEAARRGTELLPVHLDAGTGPFRLFEQALVETQTGELDAALGTLRTLLSVPARASKTLVEIDPRFADLVAHPDFGELP